MSNPVLDALKETTTLCCVRTKAVGLYRGDKNASIKVNHDHNAVSSASKVLVNRLAGVDALHKQIVSVQNKMSALLKDMSQPFGEEVGWRMLPNMDFEPFIRESNPIMREFKDLKVKVEADAPQMCRDAEHNKGNFNVQAVTPDELVNGYGMEVDFRPIPDSANFKGLDENTINKLKQMHDARLEAAVYAAERDTLERFVEPVTNFIKGIASYEERLERQEANPDDKSRNGIFRDTLVSNITDLQKRLSGFNISGDPRLTELGNLLASFNKVDPKVLREDPIIRSAAYERAQKVADNLKGWLAVK